MSVNASRARLMALTRELLVQWDATRAHWRDARAAEFERRYITELRTRVERAAAVIEKLEQLLTRVRNDCE
jgi:hypothetical protein